MVTRYADWGRDNAPSHIMHVDVCMMIQNKDWEKTKTSINAQVPECMWLCA
jgi:hypothetical protein